MARRNQAVSGNRLLLCYLFALSSRKQTVANKDVLRVLIIEDSDDYFGFLQTLLQTIGGIGVVGRVDNAERALESIQHLRPDVILVDVYLRQGNGLDVIRAVRSEAQLRQLKMVAMSSVALEEECVSAGADWFFDKASEAERLMTQFHFLTVRRH